MNMQYWEELKKDHNFLLLARDERFSEIFQDFFELEKVNELLDRARAGNNDAKRMGVAIYHEALRQQAHRTLLLRFITATQIDELDRKYKERMASQK
jgi:hypothetical protein